jgi:hypothetical protein
MQQINVRREGMKEVSTSVVHGLLTGPMGGLAVAEIIAGQVKSKSARIAA